VEGLEGLEEAADTGGTVSGMAIAGSLLSAGGDVEGAAQAWSLAFVHQSKPGLSLAEIDIDRPGMAAARERLGSRYDEIERSAQDVAREEAVQITIRRLRALQ
jgi:hypothetical protein